MRYDKTYLRGFSGAKLKSLTYYKNELNEYETYNYTYYNKPSVTFLLSLAKIAIRLNFAGFSSSKYVYTNFFKLLY